MSEGFAFGLGGALGFFYYELPDLDPPIYVVGRTAGLERDFCGRAGIGLDLRETDDPAEAWGWLRAELEAGRPTMVNADIRELEYLRVRMHNTRHDIVVCGFDEEEGVALVADNDRDEIQRCSLESLARARGSTAFPGPTHHATWVMRFPDRLAEPAAAVASAVAMSAANMRAGAPSLTGAPVAGLRMVDDFAASYPGWPERFGERLGSALRGLRVFIVKAGTGGAMFRSLQADFLAEAGTLLGDERLAEAAGVYRGLAGAWIALADAAADGAQDPAAAHAAGAPHVERIARLEHAGVAALEAAAGAGPRSTGAPPPDGRATASA
jgi:hypothetical protein